MLGMARVHINIQKKGFGYDKEMLVYDDTVCVNWLTDFKLGVWVKVSI